MRRLIAVGLLLLGEPVGASEPGPFELLQASLACDLPPHKIAQGGVTIWENVRKARVERTDIGLIFTFDYTEVGFTRGGWKNLQHSIDQIEFKDIKHVGLTVNFVPNGGFKRPNLPEMTIECAGGATCIDARDSILWDPNFRDRNNCSATAFCGKPQHRGRSLTIKMCDDSAVKDAKDALDALRR
jgi:hypothetical protein